MSALKAGWATRDITPPLGVPMGGYLARSSAAVSVGDRLSVRAIALADDQNAVALLSLDLVGLAAAVVAEIRSRIEVRAGLESLSVMVCCTHTHAGPLTFPFRGMGVIDQAYLSLVVEAAAGVVADALERLETATLSYCQVSGLQVGVNRREDRNGRTVIGHNPDGPTCDYAHVVRADCAEKSCILFSHACHPNVLGPENNSLSADFVGVAVAYVERQTGATALFVNGACGDINPRIKGGPERVTLLGRELGHAVVAGVGSCRQLASASLASASLVLQLPLVEPPSRSQLAVEKLVLKLKMGLVKLAGRDVSWQLSMQGQLDWAEEMLAVISNSDNAQTQRFEIQAFKLGPLVLLGMEGEMFVRYQLRLEATEQSAPVMLCGYANGCIGYVPTADEYVRGGYEVGSGKYNFNVNAGTEAYKVYPSVQMISPDSEGVIMEGARTLLEKVRQ